MRVKGKPDREEIEPDREEIKGIIYKVRCKCGAVHIGETVHNLHIRLQEHKCTIINKDSKNSITTHVMENDHTVYRGC